MAIKSILIANAEMVQAILGGRKTCIRQIIKGYIPQNAQFGYSAFTPDGQISCRGLFEATGRPRYGEKFFKLPYQPGDILYVRETWYKGLEWKGNRNKMATFIYYAKRSGQNFLKSYGCKSRAVAGDYRRRSES